MTCCDSTIFPPICRVRDRTWALVSHKRLQGLLWRLVSIEVGLGRSLLGIRLVEIVVAWAGRLAAEVLNFSNSITYGRLRVIHSLDLLLSLVHIISRPLHFRFSLNDFICEICSFLLIPSVFPRRVLSRKLVSVVCIIGCRAKLLSNLIWILSFVKYLWDVSLLRFFAQTCINDVIFLFQEGSGIG